MRTSVIPFLAVFLGCTPTSDPQKLGSSIQGDLTAKGVTLTAMTCPKVRLRAGTVFQCTAIDSNGTNVVFDVTASGDTAGTVSWKLRGKIEDMQVVGDRLEKAISSHEGHAVDVVCPSKNIVIAKGVTFECDAKSEGKIVRYVFLAKSDQGDWDTKISTN